MDLQKRVEKLEFHLRLLLNTIDLEKYPFYEMVIKKGISSGDLEAIFQLCTELEKKYEEHKELGYVLHTDLLVQFVGMLPPNLHPKETVVTMQKQSLFPSLMTLLLETIEQIEKENDFL